MLSKTISYDPVVDLRQRYPAWHVGLADLGGIASEVVCAEDKLILIDPRGWGGDMEMAYAHVSGHLDHHMHILDRLAACHEAEADYYAELRLDRPGWQSEVPPDCGAQNKMAMIYPPDSIPPEPAD